MTRTAGSAPSETEARDGQYSLRLLGRVALEHRQRGSIEGVLSQPKRLAVLAYVATAPDGGGRRRDEILACFWPMKTDSAARRALRQTLYFLRGHLGPEALVTRADLVALDPALWTCDVQQLLAAHQAGNVRRVAELYVGDLMPGFHVSGAREWEDWLETQRSGLRELAVDALWELGRSAAGRQDWQDAKEHFDGILAIRPFNEEALVHKTTALLELGRVTEARESVGGFQKRFRADLEQELSAKTAEELQDVFGQRGSLVGSPTRDGESPVESASRPLIEASLGLSQPDDSAAVSTGTLEAKAGKGRALRPAAFAVASIAVLAATQLWRTGGDDSDSTTTPLSTTDSVALAYWDQAMDLASQWQLDLTQNEYLVSLLDAALDRDPTFAEALSFKGSALATRYQTLGMDRQNAVTGVELIGQAARLNPQSPAVLFDQAYSLYQLGRLTETRTAALAGARLRPTARLPARMLDAVEYERGNFQKSLRWASAALRAWSEDETTMMFVGVKFLILGDLDRAELWMTKAQTLQPRGFMGLLAAVDIARGQLETAELRVDSAMVGRPDFSLTWRRAAEVAIVREDWEAVVDRTTRRLSLGPQGVSRLPLSPLAKRGLALVRLGQPDRARPDLEAAKTAALEAIATGDERWNPLIEIAAVEALFGNDSAALEWLAKAHSAGMRAVSPSVVPAFDELRDHPTYQGLLEAMARQREMMLRDIRRDGLEPPRS